jgi:hypothetical protein
VGEKSEHTCEVGNGRGFLEGNKKGFHSRGDVTTYMAWYAAIPRTCAPFATRSMTGYVSALDVLEEEDSSNLAFFCAGSEEDIFLVAILILCGVVWSWISWIWIIFEDTDKNPLPTLRQRQVTTGNITPQLLSTPSKSLNFEAE